MFKRLKRIIKLSTKDTSALDKLSEEQFDKVLDTIPNIGDGQAVFFDEGSTEEFEELKKIDKFGIKKLFRTE